MSFDITVRGGTAVRLPTAGKYCADDIVVTATGGGGAADPVIEPLEVTENGTYEAPAGIDGYSPVIVNVPTGGGEEEEWFNDGDTHIWITLTEGRTSPVLGVCPNGTVTVDWGDGTTPNVLTGTSLTYTKRTPAHNYTSPGDYVIRLTVKGEMCFCGDSTNYTSILAFRDTSSSESRNKTYANAIRKIELGNSVSIGPYAFGRCHSLASIAIPNSVTSIERYAFSDCRALRTITIPNSVTSIDGYVFYSCYGLRSVAIPNSVTSIGRDAFNYCASLVSITIPNGVTSIQVNMFSGCNAITSIIIPNSVTSILNNAFKSCSSLRFCDFSQHTSVPTLDATSAFSGIPADCEIRVPAALYDEWIAATNWSTYASKIVAV